ncbi:hypothetical protein [Micromonospora sp. CA-248212]|uniref:hypothetical protein n=1 Tax=Micromonospora sp. CA-248212 TaxID=3239961 RepID=UPI003D93579A
MSRILVSNDKRSVRAELQCDGDGRWTGKCELGDWVSFPGRWYTLADLAEDAGIHMDQAHR